MARVAAIYARVSSDRQKESGTIASQTAALRERACKRGYVVPPEWVFEDDGFSGARLDRPGLEAVRDLAAEGRLEAVLVLSPDRLSRKYAYQVLLLEEFERSGVACEFVQTPAAETPQQRLLVQVQGMIAEYERAQIMERSRRGKRYKARQGSPSVLSGAPYGYRYVKRSEGMEARYEVLAREAEVVRQVFDWYAQDPCSIGEIARRLTEQGIPTRTGKQRWDRSVIWAMLRNPAYSGRAGYGKTGTGERQRVTRPLRRPGKYASRRVAGQERPREEWIEIPVPALVSAERFEQAREQLEANKRHSTRRTKEPTLLQGMLVCRRCGYAYYRASTRTTKRKLYYYRCLGTDGWRYEGGARCASRPVRQDRLDAVVWGELVRLLEDPALLEAELERRLEAGRRTDPRQRRVAELRGERKRLERAGARLVTAYQEELIGLDELRRRMPPLRSRTQAVEAELEAVKSAVEERERHLRVAETLESFRERLRAGAGTLGVRERQKVLRALVKEVLVDDGEITIRHSIPVTEAGGSSPGKLAPNSSQPSPFSQSCLLRWGRNLTAAEQLVHATLHSGLEGTGLRSALQGGNRQLRRRLCGPGPSAGRDHADGGRGFGEASEAGVERGEDPRGAGAGGTTGVPRLPDWAQLPPGYGASLHWDAPEPGERSEPLPQGERVDRETLWTPGTRASRGTPQPASERLGELLLVGSGESRLCDDRSARDPAAAPVAEPQAQGEGREDGALPGQATLEGVGAHSSWSANGQLSVGARMISSESRMR